MFGILGVGCAVLPSVRFFVLAAASSIPFVSPATTLAIRHVNVLPMTSEVVLKDQTVLLDGAKIESLGTASSVQVPAGVKIIEGKGRYLMPGLVDSHVHVQSAKEFPLYIVNGVTTVFNLDGRPAHLAWREKLEKREILGPRMFTVGPMFNRPRKPEEDVAEVDRQAAAGYDAIKVYNFLTKEEYPALMAEVHRLHLPVVGHVARKPGFKEAMAQGQSIAHAEEFLYTFFNPQEDDNDEHIVLDPSRLPELGSVVKKSGAYVMPTACTYREIVQQKADILGFLKRPELQYLQPWTLAKLQPQNNVYYRGFKDSEVPQLKRNVEFLPKIVKALADAGVPLLVGTDSTDIGPVGGFSIHDELKEFVDAGVSPYEALRAATVNLSGFLGRSGEFGTIEPGARADLLLLERNPLEDITNTRGVEGIVLRGEWHDKGELEHVKEAIPQGYQAELKEMEGLLRSDPLAANDRAVAEDPFGIMLGWALKETVLVDGQALEKLVEVLRVKAPASPLISERTINLLGYALLGEKHLAEARDVMALNTQVYPKSANTFDSLADACIALGDVSNAVASYKKALAVDPKYANAEAARAYVEKHG